jgi:hypothetical protein
MLVPSVDYIFCSHIMPSKTQALWSDSRLKAVFVNILKPSYAVTGRRSCVPLELFHQDVGGITDYQCRLRVFNSVVLSLEGVSVKNPPHEECVLLHMIIILEWKCRVKRLASIQLLQFGVLGRVFFMVTDYTL